MSVILWLKSNKVDDRVTLKLRLIEARAIAQYQTTPLLLEVYPTPPSESRDPNQPIANFRCISVAPEEARFSGLPVLKSLLAIKLQHEIWARWPSLVVFPGDKLHPSTLKPSGWLPTVNTGAVASLSKGNRTCNKLDIILKLEASTIQSLPQTPAGGVGGKGSGSAGAGSGMVNGSGADHQDIRDGAAINTEHNMIDMTLTFKLLQTPRSSEKRCVCDLQNLFGEYLDVEIIGTDETDEKYASGRIAIIAAGENNVEKIRRETTDNEEWEREQNGENSGNNQTISSKKLSSQLSFPSSLLNNHLELFSQNFHRILLLVKEFNLVSKQTAAVAQPKKRLALVYRDGNLVSGSLEALVQHMVPTEEYYPDRAYLFAFLLSARLFIKPHELLGEVCALCEHQQNLNGEGGKERLQRFVPRLVQLLAEWTETFPYDFRDERVMGHVRSITQKVAAVDAAARQEVSALLQNLLLRLTALERYEEGLARLATEATTEQLSQLLVNPTSLLFVPCANSVLVTLNGSHILCACAIVISSVLLAFTSARVFKFRLGSCDLGLIKKKVDITELCPSATVLAQQLTHVELERLSYIGPEEFVQAFAKESPHLETSFKDMKKTRNLESYVQWFNRLSYFVATEVCKHAKKKQRVRVVEYWIETARECFNIGNFNSLMAIIAGLNMSPISRLKKTCRNSVDLSQYRVPWSKVQLAKFSILEHQMDPSSNFSSYRSTLKAAMWRSAGATDERQRIVVPFFSLLVKDLYFLNEGCSNKLPNGHINFEKFWQLAKQVTEFIAWKQVACPFEKNPRVIAFLQASPVLTENAVVNINHCNFFPFRNVALALASFECEPPDNNPEKERYKALKKKLLSHPVYNGFVDARGSILASNKRMYTVDHRSSRKIFESNEKHIRKAQTCNSDETTITIIVETMMSYEIKYRLMDVSPSSVL
ncbi:Ras-GEF domain-containing family member 1B [Melipona quadrifasciata]|uniref:Ras-GEF domain-containing family member 1B n=1 Tax=Melipona quadrifasciata TaxID=166423 RepID=A0A0N0BFK7_9HYME|nr:Ras-GEF domain-containing family member 1B [Melipona quadrifasciata]